MRFECQAARRMRIPADPACAPADLKKQLDIPATIKEIVGADKETAYMAALDSLSENAFDDQCTGANPRYPLIKELREIYVAAWTKPILPLPHLAAYTATHHESAVAR